MAPILTLLALAALASPGDDGLPPALRSLVTAERAFSQFSVDHGIKPAFLEFLGEEGIVFSPRATPGRKSFLDQPDEPNDKAPRAELVWRPIFADIAASGDFGYTTGPYELSFQREGVAQSRFGHYVTVWKKSSDGQWKVRIDKGIRHPNRFDAPDEVRYPTDAKTKAASARLDDLLGRDRTYGDLVAKRGAPTAFDEIASESVRLYREGGFPIVGKKAALDALEKTPLKISPEGGDVAASGDLGFTYGTAEAESGETSTYLHIWKKESGAWLLVLDNTTPLPKGS
jgi:ketosteroid isomerase-like protein